MSTLPEQAYDTWHSAVYRVSGAARDPVAPPEPDWPRVWEQAVPAGHDAPLSARVRRNELARRPDPLRLVLLRYADNVVEVVVTARRNVADRASMARIAATVLGSDTGGDSGARTAPEPSESPECRIGSVRVGDGHAAVPELLAAFALMLSRFRGGEQFGLAVVEQAVVEPAGAGSGVLPNRLSHVTLQVAGQTVAALCAAAQARAQEGGVRCDAMVVLDDGSSAPAEAAYWPAQASGAPLTLHAERGADGTLLANVWFNTEHMPAWQAEQMLRCLPQVYRNVRESPGERHVREIGLLSPADRAATLALGRSPGRSDPTSTIDAMFAEVAAGQPGRPAVTADGRTLTYRQLDDLATSMAGGLAAAGVRRGDRVGLLMARSTELVAALLAVLRAGAAYVPFDPQYPRDRLTFMAEDAGVRLVVVDDDHAGLFPNSATATVSGLTATVPQTQPAAAETADEAYVIYTSGSTGRPKGVVVPHANVMSLVQGTQGMFGFSSDDVWTWFHSAAFDFSVWEIWGCLLNGGRLVVVPRLTARSSDDLRDLLARERVTVLNQTPSAFANLLPHVERHGRPPDLRLVVFGGEPLDVRMLTRWMDALPDGQCRLVNMYGITETTVHSTAAEVTRATALTGSRSVGRAIPGWSLRVVDESGNVLPPGCLGEIIVGGAGVASGYLNRPELTADRFRFDAQTGERTYCSGDRGRLLLDGSVEHFGRIDSQVKLRGYRIELDEIRSVLLERPDVAAAAVLVADRTPGHGDAELRAYVVARSGTAADGAALRRWLSRRLPDFMLPAAVVAVDELPLDANGKLDAARLPVPRREASRRTPTSGIEGLVSEIWRDVLGQDLGPETDFFDVGGNSLLALRVTTALRERGLSEVSVRSLYLHPTLRSFSSYLGALRRSDVQPVVENALGQAVVESTGR
jgi:amino acid adenylation domain-containing protein